MVDRTVFQIKIALSFILVVVVTGTIGYKLIEGWDLFDAFYMTIISVTTTGFREVYPLSPGGKFFTLLIIIMGVVTIAYAGGRFAQFFIESYVFRRRKMNKKLSALRDHYIICGYGRMGKRICQELHEHGAPFVVIEKDPGEIESLRSGDFLFVEGDATDDDILERAHIQMAKGLVAALPTEAQNVFATLSAKVMNPGIFIVARAVEEQNESKLLKAGANRVVKPYEIGGHRMAQVLLRPGVVDFIDIIARDRRFDLHIEEIIIEKNSSLVGLTLANSPIRNKLNVIIVAISDTEGRITYNPQSQTTLRENDKLIVIGEEKNIKLLINMAVGDAS